MKRIVTATFEFCNQQDFRKVIAVFTGIEGAPKGLWCFYFKRGIKVIKFMRLDNYPCAAEEITFENARVLLLVHGFLTDRNEPENGY